MKRSILLGSRALPGLAAALACALLAHPSTAQPGPGAPPAAVPATAAPPAGAVAAPTPATGETTASPDALAAALGPRAGGLTPESVGKSALVARTSIRTRQAELKAAAARVDQFLIGFFPRISFTAGYSRLSKVDTSLGGGAILAARNEGPVFVGNNPAVCPPAPGSPPCIVDAQGGLVGAAAFELPSPQNAYSVQASIAVPISDYVLRFSRGYAAATLAVKAKKIAVDAESLQASADAKIAFWNWVRAKGQVAVASGAVAQAKAHADDARRVFGVGLLSRADVLRLEAQVASAEQFLAEAEAFQTVVEQQLRIAIGVAGDKPLEIGIDVMHQDAAPPTESIEQLYQVALERRLEIRALDETQHSLRELEAVTRSGYLPRLDAFATSTYANPNPRLFPQKEEWSLTWEAGVRLTWTVNDAVSTIPAVTEAKANTAVVVEQKAALRDGLKMEVTSAYADLKRAASSIEAADRGLAAAEESLRVRRELFRIGRATSVDLIDAETEVTSGRLRRLDTHIGVLVAKTRLEHATGRDVRDVTGG